MYRPRPGWERFGVALVAPFKCSWQAALHGRKGNVPIDSGGGQELITVLGLCARPSSPQAHHKQRCHRT